MSAFCFSPEMIDLQLFQLWLSGLTVSQVASLREDADPLLRDVLEIDTADQFRLFDELHPVLEEPKSNFCLLELPDVVKRKLSERFYSFDDTVVREFLGRRINTKARKDWLDEVSDSTGVPRRSCLRQFDNLRRKRIYDAADEIGFQVQASQSLNDILAEEFCLPKHLMVRYEAVLFLMYHRFNISSGKKKILYVNLKDFEFCAGIIMNAWCVKMVTSISQRVGQDQQQPQQIAMESPLFIPSLISPTYSTNNTTEMQYLPFEFDTVLFVKFRDLKSRFLNQAGEVWNQVSSSIEDVSDRKRLESRFKPWFRSLLTCATGRDLKDFFEDLIVDVVEPALRMKPELEKAFNVEDLANRELFYLEKLFDLLDRVIVNIFSTIDVQLWQTLLAGIKPCTLHLASVHPDRQTIEPESEEIE